MKSCVYPLSPRLNYLPQISHAREAQIARLMANDDIHGHADEYRRSSGVLNLASRIAWPTWPIRLLLGCASKDRSRNSDMAVPCRTKLRSAHDSTNRFARCFNCGQYSTISGARSGFCAAVAQLAVENLRDSAICAFGGTLLHRKLRAMIGQADDSGTKMMATGTVKSFSPAKGYGFIKTDTGGVEVFVHLSAIREAGLADLRKGQKISFEIFDNQGKAAAKESEH